MKNDAAIRNLMDNIVLLRKERRISKNKMAQLLGIGAVTLNKIENGEYPMCLRIGVIIKLSEHFGFTPKELLSWNLGRKYVPRI